MLVDGAAITIRGKRLIGTLFDGLDLKSHYLIGMLQAHFLAPGLK